MDASAYLPMFLAEAREHLQELNLSLVRVEDDPQDRSTVDEIFRIAHSLKGMSATMGFARIAELTHAMEDVFELLRQRASGLDRAAIDVLLGCLDALGISFDAIEADGAEVLDPEPLIEQLRTLVREPEPEAAAAAASGAPTVELLRELAAGARVIHAAVTLDESVGMPAVRAYMLLAAGAEHGEVLASVPTEDGVDEFHDRLVELWLASDHELEAVAKTLSGVGDVVDVRLDECDLEADAAAEPPQAEAAPAEPESAPAAVELALVPAAAALAEAAPAHPARKPSATVRVEAERLDQLMHLMGELVVNRTRVESLVEGSAHPALAHALQDLARSSQALQAQVMQVRMVPVEAVFLRLPRLVRDLSGKLDKQVELVLAGQDTELDRTVVDAIGDPLVHLVRNSLDHGIESPAERAQTGKPQVAQLVIAARHAGGNVVIEVRDDGRGIDPAKVGRKAAQAGLISPESADSIDLPRAIELLFAPGFSTAEQTSDVSGRGVGMDAVRTTVRGLGGDVSLTSEFGVGTTAIIRLPLTLAILATLLVEANGRPLAIPLERVERTIRLSDHPVRSLAGAPMLVLGDGVLPLLDLGAAVGERASNVDCENAVIVRGGESRLALRVERLVGQRELVTRPLPTVAAAPAVSGGAVLADGQIALIVDCDRLAEVVGAGTGAALTIDQPFSTAA